MYTRQGQLSKQIFDAVIYENIPQLKNLINRGVGIDTPSIDGGKQVLHIACEHKKSVPFIVNLLELNANVNAKTDRSFTPLHVAAQKGNEEVVLELLKARADLEAIASLIPKADDAKGTTPLQEAAHHGHLNVVKILVMAGANTQYRETQYHLTAADLAARQEHQTIVLALMGYEKEFIMRVRQVVEEWRNTIEQIGIPAAQAYFSRITNIPYGQVSGDDYFRRLQPLLNEGYESLRESPIKNFRNAIIVCMKQYNTDKVLASKVRSALTLAAEARPGLGVLRICTHNPL